MHRRGGEGPGRNAQKPGGSGSQRNAQNIKKLQFQAQKMHRWGPPRGAEMHKRDPQGVRKCTKSVLEGSKNAQNNAQCRGNPPPPVHLLREGGLHPTAANFQGTRYTPRQPLEPAFWPYMHHASGTFSGVIPGRFWGHLGVILGSFQGHSWDMG